MFICKCKHWHFFFSHFVELTLATAEHEMKSRSGKRKFALILICTSIFRKKIYWIKALDDRTGNSRHTEIQSIVYTSPGHKRPQNTCGQSEWSAVTWPHLLDRWGTRDCSQRDVRVSHFPFLSYSCFFNQNTQQEGKTVTRDTCGSWARTHKAQPSERRGHGTMVAWLSGYQARMFHRRSAPTRGRGV